MSLDAPFKEKERRTLVRDLEEGDIPMILDYWYRSPPAFIESRAVDPAKMPSESEMRTMFETKVRDNQKRPVSKINILAILYDGEAVGFHSINPLFENDFGIFHAHICRPEFRHKGIAMRSYPLACRVYFERFNLKKIVFKTPLQNVGAIRVKEKLGIPAIGEETIDFTIVKAGTRAKVFIWTREDFEQSLGRLGI